MKKTKIIYLGYYSPIHFLNEQRCSSPAATNMMHYVANCFVRNGFSVTIISLAQTTAPHYFRGKTITLENEIIFKSLPTFYGKSWVVRALAAVFRKVILYWTLLRIPQKSILVVYHSLSYSKSLAFLKRIKRCKIVLQVCEIYSDVTGNMNQRKEEFSSLKFADGYIFANEYLSDNIINQNKPKAICYGTYQVESYRRRCFRDDKIHVVYAGTLNPHKGGASAAAATAEFLDKRYHIHIIGFGNPADKQNIVDIIDKVSKSTECAVTFDGLKNGEEYIRFLQSCDIGLSTQNPDAAFNETSFPSKVLSYMSNGLQVVSIRIPAIENSKVGNDITYYDNQNPKEIAAAIKSVNIANNNNSKELLVNLDLEFCRALKNLINELQY